MNKKIVGLVLSMLLFVTVFSVTGTSNNGKNANAMESLDVDWWPYYRHDSSHSGASSSPAPGNVLRWNVLLNASKQAPVIFENILYVIGENPNMVYALKESDGSIIWSYVLSAAATSCTMNNGKIYLGSAANILCIDAAGNGDGTTDLIWQYTIGSGSLNYAPTVDSGKVYVASSTGIVLCVNAEGNGDGTTTLVWLYTLGQSSADSPALYDGKVYIRSKDYIKCLNATGDGNGTTSLLWQQAVNVDSALNPMTLIVSNGFVYASSKAGTFYCLNANNGSIVWLFEKTGSKIYSFRRSPVLYEDRIYQGVQFQDATGFYAGVFCLDATPDDNGDGVIDANDTDEGLLDDPGSAYDVIWYGSSLGDPSNILASISVADNRVYVSTRNTSNNITLYSVKATSGTIDWSYLLDAIASDPIIANGKLFIQTQAKSVLCFGNQAPVKPTKPTGPAEGFIGDELTFTTTATDPNNDQIWYQWKIGSITTEWIGPYNSGEEVEQKLTCSEAGDISIKVKTKDAWTESGWSDVLHIMVYQAELEISGITGGLLRVDAIVSTIKGGDATDVQWNITIDGMLVLSGGQASGTIPSLAEDASQVVTDKPVLGFGPVTITVQAGGTNIKGATKTVDGFVFLFYVIIK